MAKSITVDSDFASIRSEMERLLGELNSIGSDYLSHAREIRSKLKAIDFQDWQDKISEKIQAFIDPQLMDVLTNIENDVNAGGFNALKEVVKAISEQLKYCQEVKELIEKNKQLKQNYERQLSSATDESTRSSLQQIINQLESYIRQLESNLREMVDNCNTLFSQLAAITFAYDLSSLYTTVVSEYDKKAPEIISDINTPITPGGNTPITPGDNTPITPGDNTPITPGGNTPITPGGNTPITPGDNTPITPGGNTREDNAWWKVTAATTADVLLHGLEGLFRPAEWISSPVCSLIASAGDKFGWEWLDTDGLREKADKGGLTWLREELDETSIGYWINDYSNLSDTGAERIEFTGTAASVSMLVGALREKFTSPMATPSPVPDPSVSSTSNIPTSSMPSIPDIPALPAPSTPNIPALPAPSTPNIPALPEPSIPTPPSGSLTASELEAAWRGIGDI